MRKKIEEFFLGLKNPNFLAMKLLLQLFEKFKEDDCSRRIIDNIGVLSQYDIRLIYSEELYSYVFSEDDLSQIDYAITSSGSEEVACHEFGHLLLDIFARGELPEEFFEVNEKCKKRLLENKGNVSMLLQKYRDDALKKITKDIIDPLGFYNRHPELRDEYFLKYPDNTDDDMVQDILIEHFALVSAFDNDIVNYNNVANIIDGIFCGENPFVLDYGNDQIDPILSMHHEDYFETGDFEPYVMGFEEQFADYLVLRTYPEKMGEASSTLCELLGNEWVEMMDKFYDKVTSRIGERGKVHQYK